MSRSNRTFVAEPIDFSVISDPLEVIDILAEDNNLIRLWNQQHVNNRVTKIQYNEIIREQLNDFGINPDTHIIFNLKNKYVIYDLVNDLILDNFRLKFLRVNGKLIIRSIDELDTHGESRYNRTYYDNGQIKREIIYKSNELTFYDKNGILRFSGNFYGNHISGKIFYDKNPEYVENVPISYLENYLGIHLFD